jgi:hypothetical protein
MDGCDSTHTTTPRHRRRGRTRAKVPDHCVVIFVLAGLQLSFLNTKRNASMEKGDVHVTSASTAILPTLEY